MPQMFDLFAIAPTISALYKTYLDGRVHVSNLPDRMIVTFFVYDQDFLVYGREPKETFDFQIVLHSDGRIVLNYGPEPQDPDEAFGDGIVGVFPGTVKTGLLGSIPDSGGRLRSRAPRSCGNRALRDRRARSRVGRVHDKRSHPSRSRARRSSTSVVIDDWDFSRWSRPAAGRQPNGLVGRREASVRPRCR